MEDYDDEVDLYPQDRREKEYNPDMDDDPWEGFGECWSDEDEDDQV